MYILLSFCSYVFWMGDLNYRINETIENIKGLCAKQEYSTLWEHDQVRNYENMAISDSDFFRALVLQKRNWSTAEMVVWYTNRMRLLSHLVDVTKCLLDTNHNPIQRLESEALRLKGTLYDTYTNWLILVKQPCWTCVVLYVVGVCSLLSFGCYSFSSP